MATVINQHGITIDYDMAVNLMDDDIREKTHELFAPCGDQMLFDVYCALFAKKYHEEFEPNKANPQM